MKRTHLITLFCLATAATAVSISACSKGSHSAAYTATAAPITATPPAATAAPVILPMTLSAQTGAKLFFDTSLSASGKQSCASCHDPNNAYSPSNSLAVQPGGADLKSHGTRAAPSLRYKEYTPIYSDQFENPDQISPPGPGGGYAWDGRADTLADQARIPLLAANEMANASPEDVVKKIESGANAELFKKAFGQDIFKDSNKAFAMALAALQAFQIEDNSFHPYSSKFDRYRNNKIGGALTDQEFRGLRLFMDPKRGNCMGCHLLGPGNNGSQDMLTDYSFEAIGVPRNMEIAANADPAYYDLGLCGPARTDHVPAKPGVKNAYCGMFKTPTLRNIATRHVFMHNGYFKSLRDVLKFYNTRDTQPELWYPKDAHGKVQKFNDLPRKYWPNLDPSLPLDQRPAGSKPVLSAQDMDDLIAFMNILTDGYKPAATPVH